MKHVPARCESFFQSLIVSCQAPDGDPFGEPDSMARFARAAALGGAAGIRTNGPDDIAAIRQAVSLPIIGIQKRLQADGRILITPDLEDARKLVAAGADIIALDCTARGQRFGAVERVRQIHGQLGVPVMADIATVEEAVTAAAAGADLVASTMRGYTAETESVRNFEPAFIRELVTRLGVPVVAEGRIDRPEQAAEAIRAGAFAVIVGTAITRPGVITSRFVGAIHRERSRSNGRHYVIGIDLGGTNTKSAIVSRDGKLAFEFISATPPGGGRDALIEHLKRVAFHAVEVARGSGCKPTALGVATAGWVDPLTGRVVYATDNLPGWTGTPIADELQAAIGLPVAVENDANALAIAERHFGRGRDVDDFVCITLGTGVGGGCYIAGRLNRGAHFFANALGHIPIQHGGLPCTCGRKGCLEVYANAAALLRYAGQEFATAEDVIRAANSGENIARRALRTYAAHLGTGIVSIVHLLDPSVVVLSGGIAQDNPLLVSELNEQLPELLIAPGQRRLQVEISQLGYYGGVLGAAAIAIEKSP